MKEFSFLAELSLEWYFIKFSVTTIKSHLMICIILWCLASLVC